MSNDKFKDVTTEEETRILFSSPSNFKDYEVLHQKWSYEGILAESLIFYNDDVSMSKEELIKYVKESPLVTENSQLTYSKGDTYTFVNFNFVS